MYNDGILTLFLNAKGEIGGNDSLKHLLDFLINTNDDNAIDSDLENIQHIVHTIKSNAKVGERYMSMLDDLYHEKNKSKEEGIKLGKEQLAETLLELGVDPLLLEKAMKAEPK